jgi:TolB-like protein
LARFSFSDLAERRIFRFVVAYGAGAWAVLELMDQLTNNGVLPQYIYRATLAFALCGLPGALVVSWFHGAKGRQEVPRIEKWLLSIVAIFAIVTTGLVIRRGAGSSNPRGAGGGLEPFEDPSRIAVLYFEPRGGGDTEFLASGLTEALIDELGGVQGLHVVSRNGSQLFRGITASIDSIGRTLQAGTIVSGTVAQAGERVRVDITLASAATGKQYASTRLERGRSEIFELQDQLADTVSVFLRKAVGVELGELRLRRGTGSVEAWEKVQQSDQAAAGSAVMASSGDLAGAARSLATADSLLAVAESLDRSWLEPLVRRGWLAYQQSRLGGMDRDHYDTWIGRGMVFADSAIRLDSTYASAVELRATLEYWTYILNLAASPEQGEELLRSAEAGFREAIALDPERASALTSLSHLLLNKGEVAEAKLNALRAYESDPFLENANLTIWRIFLASWNLEDVVEARRYCLEGVRRFPHDYRFSQCQLMLYSLPGVDPDISRAWALVDTFAQQSPAQVTKVNRRRGYMYVAMALARSGARDSARSVMLAGRAGTDIDPLHEVALLESIARTANGDVDEAVRQLSVYFAANPGTMEAYRTQGGSGELPWYHQALLNEPRFRSLVGLR